MSNPVATVTYTQGQVWAKSPDGNLRPLQAGSVVMADEVIVTAEGASVELDFGDGIPVAIAGSQEVAMGRDLWDELAAGADEAAVEDESVRQALAILEQGGDLLEELEDTAAGLTGGTGGGGTSFVQLARLTLDTPESNRFEFDDILPLPTAAAQQETRSINYPPVTADLNLQGDEDTAITGRIPATDADGDALTYQIATQPAHGSVVLDTTTGQFVYVPSANYHGDDGFVVTITDARGNSTTSSVRVTVAPVNDLPVTADMNLSTDEDSAVAGQVLVTDVDGDALGFTLGTAPARGSVTLDPVTGHFVYTPTANFNGTDSFVVVISDGQGGSVASRVTVNVAPVNDVPVTSDITLTTEEDVAVSGQVNATDIDGDALRYAVTSAPQHGVLILNPATGEFTYTPDSHYHGSDSFIVVISDGNGGTTSSTVSIGVTSVNDVPVIAPVALGNVNEDGSIFITQADLLAGASDLDGDALTAINLSLTIGNGSLVDNDDGTWTFTPAADWSGDVSFAFEVSDGTVNMPNTALLTVVSENDAPIASDLVLATDEDVAITGQVSVIDIEGDALSYVVTTSPQNGVLVLNPATGEFTYTPDSHYHGSDSFIVTISDGNGGTTTSTVSIGVAPVNDPPVIAPVTLAEINEDGSTVITQADLLAGASDLDGDALTAINLSLTTGSGSLVNNGDGTWTFAPATDWSGDVSFAFEVSDGTVNMPNTAALTVVPANDAPVTSNFALSTDEDVAVSGQVNATDVDGDLLNYAVTTAPQNGVLILNPTTGEFTYTPNPYYNGQDSFVIAIYDGNGGTTTSTATVTVNAVDNPSILMPDLEDVDEDTTLIGNVLSNDGDVDSILQVISFNVNGADFYAGDTATITGIGTLSVLANGEYTFIPAPDYNGLVPTISYTTNTGFSSTLDIVVNPVNDAPVAGDEGVVFSSGLNGEYWAYHWGENDDGASLNNLGQVLRFIMNRPADASFLATEIDYGTINGDLGADGKLQEFLDHDQSSLSNDPRNTNQAIIKMSGFIDLVPGDYQLRVTADDGYSIRIDGKIVAEYDGNQISTTRLGPTFSVASDGKQLIEIIYWDSVDEARLFVEISRDGGEFSVLTGDILSSSNDAFTTREDQPLVLSADTLLSNDTDVDGDDLSIQSVQDSVNGTVSLAGNTVIFTPDANYAGPASFSYTVSDGNGGTATATVTINVKPVNDAPVLANHHGFLNAVSASGLNAKFYNYSEPLDGPNITSLDIVESFIAANTPNATFVSTSLFYGLGNNNLGAGNNLQDWIGNDSGSLVYQDRQSTSDAILHAQGKIFLEAGTYNFRVRADDGYSIKINGNTVAEINYIQSPTGSTHDPFTITQSGYYDLDVLYWDQGGQFVFEVEMSSDGGASYSPLDPSLLSHQPQSLIYTVTASELLTNATDVDGDDLNVLRVDNAVGGSASFNATTGIVTFIVEPGYTGTPSFEYTVTDGNGGRATATTFINIVRNQFQGDEGSDVITGTSSVDQLTGLDGNDSLIGGAGNDYLSGGLGADTFAWNLGDAGSAGIPAVDKISDFSLVQGDVLSLADLLQGEESSPLTDYLHFENDGGNTRIHISSTGGYAGAGYDANATDQIIVLEGVSLSGTNAELITQLQNANNLQVD